MSDNDGCPRRVHFSVFEADLRTGELRRQGLKVKLHGQPFHVLAMLLEHPGELVTREEIREKLWPQDTFIDFEHSVNSSIKRLREALGDDAATPRFIETLPRHGYRFIAPVETLLLSPTLNGKGDLETVSVPQPPSPEAERPTGPSEDAVMLASSPAKHRDAGVAASAGTRRLRVQKRRVTAAIVGVPVLLLAILVGLNVFGLRDHLLLHPAPVPKIDSIAVLPLENLSRDPEQEYFADGMTEELITNLGKIGALHVISRTSVMRYKGTKKPLPEIAKELNVDALVEGTVLRSGNRVRVTANLLHARTDRHLWAETYERDFRDVISLQDEVAQTVARAIKVALSPAEATRLVTARTVKPEAYELYLKGRYEGDKLTEEGLKRSLEYFQQVINLDPTHALAYSGVADSYMSLGGNGFLAGAEVYPKAKAAALRALELDENLAEAHVSLGYVLFNYNRDHETALKEYEAAIRLNPNYVPAHQWYALSLTWMGRGEEAVREIEQAQRLDPLSVTINRNVVYVFFLTRQYDRAIVAAHHALELEPNNPWTHTYLARTYLQKGMNKEALAEFQKRLSLQPTFPKASAEMALAYAATGNREEALEILGKLKQPSMREYVSPYFMARAYVGLGQKQEALVWLQKGFDIYDGDMHQLKVDPAFDPLRSDPRFQDLLRHMNFPP